MTPPRRSYIRRNRPAQTGELVGVRLQPGLIAAIDAWRAAQPGLMTRPNAIRALAATALAGQRRPQAGFVLSDMIFTDELVGETVLELAPARSETAPAPPVEIGPDDGGDQFVVAVEPAPISRSHEIEPPAKPKPIKAPDLLGPLGPMKLSPRDRRR